MDDVERERVVLVLRELVEEPVVGALGELLAQELVRPVENVYPRRYAVMLEASLDLSTLTSPRKLGS